MTGQASTGQDTVGAAGAPDAGQHAITDDEVRAALNAIVRSETFVRSDRARALVIYLVETSLDGKADRLKGFTIGQDVFGKDDDFDPATDAVVRVQAGRLREQLASFYRNEGADQPIEISVPKGTYVPQYRRRTVTDGSVVPNGAGIGAAGVRPVDFGVGASDFKLDGAAAQNAQSVSGKLKQTGGKGGQGELLTPFIVRNVKRFWFALAAILLLLWVILFSIWS